MKDALLKHFPYLFEAFKNIMTGLITILAVILIVNRKHRIIFANGFYDLLIPEIILIILLSFSLILYIRKNGTGGFSLWIKQYRIVMGFIFLSILLLTIKKHINPFPKFVTNMITFEEMPWLFAILEVTPEIIWTCILGIFSRIIYDKSNNLLWSNILCSSVWTIFGVLRNLCVPPFPSYYIFSITDYYFNAYAYPFFFYISYGCISLGLYLFSRNKLPASTVP